MFRKVALSLLTMSVAAFAVPQAATALTPVPPGVYLLHDHPDAALWDHASTSGPNGPYGLRMDYLPGEPGPTFSMEQGGAQVHLSWDGGATALISGQIQHNVDGDLWGLSFTITGITAEPGANGGGFTALGGNGLIWDLNSADQHVLDGKQDNSGVAFRFLGDGHRMPNDNDTPNGRGWINNDGVNDFLFTATPVPEPGTIALLSLGLASGLSRLRRRNR